jgi:hypothetical protein
MLSNPFKYTIYKQSIKIYLAYFHLDLPDL